MKLERVLEERSEGSCELCKRKVDLQLLEVLPQDQRNAENCIMACAKCVAQIEKREELDSHHWQPLKETMWSEVPGVQVTAWRMLSRLREESWAAESLEMLYLTDELMTWAKATGDHEAGAAVELHRDAHGAILQQGDNVVLTKSLDVKGSSVNAKVGTVVRNIRLVPDNTDQIEGRIEGQLIVILTKYVRRQG